MFGVAMPLRWLCIDFNAYFASVEQQVRPELRGRPVAVAPVMADSGCCIAASYEAKARGVTTGTRVGEARRLCPGIVIVDARPRLYVHMHHRLLGAIDRCIPISDVMSIDEALCKLAPNERDPAAAGDLARRIKASIRERAGVCMRCSIGVAPNRLLAKVATDMQKPDGLVILNEGDLPHRLFVLRPIELAGIGPRMNARLERAGITTVEQLCAKSESELERLWGGVVGRRWWHWLRGADLSEAPMRKRSLGHQHVLAPEFRTPEGARAVAMRLLHKAAARLRSEGWAARTLVVSIRHAQPGGNSAGGPRWGGGGGGWSASASLGACCRDTATMLDALRGLWPRELGGKPFLVAVTLVDLVSPDSMSLPLFAGESRRNRIAEAMDKVNERFGANTVYTSSIHGAREAGRGGIAFKHVPRIDIADTVGSGPGRISDRELLEEIERSLDPRRTA